MILSDSGKRSTIFDRDSMKLYVHDGTPGTRLFEEIQEATRHPQEDERLESTLPLIPFHRLTNPETALSRGPLTRLTINISNNCNLWCEYCYADHGFYHSPRSLMSVDTARQIVDAATTYYDPINVVHFFGGEPLMNSTVIEFCCEYLTRLHESGLISALPKFVATTNGTILNERLLSLIKRYQLGLTISIDGPKKIHDAARPSVKGSSSYDRVVGNVRNLVENLVEYQIECTYSIHHVRAGISIIDLMDFFWDEFGHQVSHIAPASTPKNSSFHLLPEQVAESYAEATRYSVDNVFGGNGPAISFVIGVLRRLLTKQRALSCCPAFFDQMSIAVNGDAYPCFMFIGDDKFRMGNVLRDSFPNEASIRVRNTYLREFETNWSGKSSWYAPLSFGCVAGDYLASATGGLGSNYFESVWETIIENVLVSMGKHYDDLSTLTVENLRRWEMDE